MKVRNVVLYLPYPPFFLEVVCVQDHYTTLDKQSNMRGSGSSVYKLIRTTTQLTDKA